MSTGGSITISEPGTYRIFLEYPGANDALTTSPGGFVTITGPSGPVPVLPDSSTQSYGLNGREGRQLGKFEADVAGTYDVRTIAHGRRRGLGRCGHRPEGSVDRSRPPSSVGSSPGSCWWRWVSSS